LVMLCLELPLEIADSVQELLLPPHRIGRKVLWSLSEGCGDRATALIEDIRCEKIRGCRGNTSD